MEKIEAGKCVRLNIFHAAPEVEIRLSTHLIANRARNQISGVGANPVELRLTYLRETHTGNHHS